MFTMVRDIQNLVESIAMVLAPLFGVSLGTAESLISLGLSLILVWPIWLIIAILVKKLFLIINEDIED